VPDPASLDDVFNLDDFEPIARERLARGTYGYYSSGAGDERTLADNLSAWAAWRLVPRVLTGSRSPELRTAFLGSESSTPFAVAPTALHGLAHPDGEMATARAAAAAGTLFTLSTASTRTIEAVAHAAAAVDAPSRGPRWFQLYVEHDLGYARELVARAEAAGYEAIVLTVDLPLVGYRERDLRNRFAVPAAIQAHLPHGADTEQPFTDYIDTKPELRWEDVATIAHSTRLPLVLKGILAPDDVARAVDHGARGIIVSNHGGRQLDGVVTAPQILPEIVEAAAGRVEVFADGGIRRGSDVLVALALGARGVFIGRPIVYALAAAGQDGVARAIELLTAEVRRGLTLLGVTSVAEVTGAHVRPAHG
jgi:isopentenyl diphosphate isomerase/L-lactate dehydrogenase-like FMN-dependent dehydrogenase